MPVRLTWSSLDFWSLHHLRFPEGLQPGQYDLRAVVYELEGAELAPQEGGVELDLGTLEVAAHLAPRGLLWPAVTLAPCLVLRSVSPDSITASIGAPFDLDLLWETRCQSADDVALRFLEDDNGWECRHLLTHGILNASLGSGLQPERSSSTGAKLHAASTSVRLTRYTT